MSLGPCYYTLGRTRIGHRALRFGVCAARRMGLLRDFHLPFDALSLDHGAVAPLMHLWPKIHWSCGDGMMPPMQMLAIYRLAVGWPGRGDTVELGSWTGLTTCYLAAACSARGQGKVHAVDTFEGNKEDGETYRSIEKYGGSTLTAFHERIQCAGFAGLVETHVGLTAEIAAEYVGAPIRLLLIDADHSYEGVRADFLNWSPHVQPGGLIIFHDYLMDTVARCVDQVVGNDRTIAPLPGLVEENVMAVTKKAAP